MINFRYHLVSLTAVFLALEDPFGKVAAAVTLWLLRAPELRARTREALFGGPAAADEPVY